jgi:hypothetical protein
MSPTLLPHGKLRFYFYSREEPRAHVHVSSPDGEAKIWLEPEIALEWKVGFHPKDLRTAMRVARENRDDFSEAWSRFFDG